MGQKLYQSTPEGGIRFSTERKPGEVRIPNYVYDLWLPLIGITAIGVYAVYCRLERGESVKAITLADIAKACRIGTDKLRTANESLTDCGFIEMHKPTGNARLMHWTTEIIVKDPPRTVTEEQIKKYAKDGEFSTLTPWLVDLNQNLNPNSDEPESRPGSGSESAPIIATLDELQPLEVASIGAEAPQTKPIPVNGNNGHALQQSFLGEGTPPPAPPVPPPPPKKIAPPAAHVYREVLERWPQKSQWDDLATIEDLEYWRQIVKAWDGHGWNKTNVAGMFEFYQAHREDRTLPVVSNGRVSKDQETKRVLADAWAKIARVKQEEQQTIEGEYRYG